MGLAYMPPHWPPKPPPQLIGIYGSTGRHITPGCGPLLGLGTSHSPGLSYGPCWNRDFVVPSYSMLFDTMLTWQFSPFGLNTSWYGGFYAYIGSWSDSFLWKQPFRRRGSIPRSQEEFVYGYYLALPKTHIWLDKHWQSYHHTVRRILRT